MTVEFDEIGRRVKLSATGQSDTAYTYDAASQFKTVTKGTQTVTLNYDDAGRRTSLTYPNGVVSSYGYDNANRLLTIGHVKTPTTIEALTYTYDKSGNRITQLRQNAAASNLPTAVAAANIGYDAANELTRWNSPTTNLTYDNNGNLATETQGGVTTTYTWDARNRLTGISRTGLTASFVYDGLGRRISKTINGSTVGFWYDDNDVYADLTGATPSTTYIRGLNIDERYIRKSASDEFYETDALGTSVVLTDSAGASQTTYTYEPFGNTTQAGSASTNAFQYTGRENDETGLYYYRARNYSPALHRFATEDPVRFSTGTLNFYLYVDNQPINQVDPTGECPWCVAGALSALTDLSVQLLMNGGRIDCVSWEEVGISAFSGAVGVGLAQKFAKIGTAFAGPDRPTYGFFELKKVLRVEAHPLKDWWPNWASYPHWHLDALGKDIKRWHLPIVEPVTAAVALPVNAAQNNCKCSGQ